MKHTQRKTRVHKTDKLRTRIWFVKAMQATGRITSHAFWLHVDKKISSRARWYKYEKGINVPRQDIVQRIEDEAPGTAQIFNALFWSVLKGHTISREEVSDELNLLTVAYTGKHKLLQIDFWMSAIEESPYHFEDLATRTILESRTGEDFLQLTILILALADNSRNDALWNYMCNAYRKYLPLYIPTVPWPFKDELFDELDKYVQRRVHSGVSRESIREDWRDAKTDVLALLKDEYEHILDLSLLDHSINRKSLPKNFTQQIAEKLAIEFCKTEDYMLHSWQLCDPISRDIATAIVDIEFRQDGEITVERIMRYLKSLGYFDISCPGYEAYAKFQHIEKYHMNFFP